MALRQISSRLVSAINDRFLYTSIVLRPSPNWVRVPGFFLVFQKFRRFLPFLEWAFCGLLARRRPAVREREQMSLRQSSMRTFQNVIVCCGACPNHLSVRSFPKRSQSCNLDHRLKLRAQLWRFFTDTGRIQNMYGKTLKVGLSEL